MADNYHVAQRDGDAEYHFLPDNSRFTFCGKGDLTDIWVHDGDPPPPRATCAVCITGRMQRHPGWTLEPRRKHPHYLHQISTPEGLIAVYEKLVKRRG